MVDLIQEHIVMFRDNELFEMYQNQEEEERRVLQDTAQRLHTGG